MTLTAYTPKMLISENEEDHKKAEGAVCSFLEKADQTYKQQQQMKAGLEVNTKLC